MTTATVSKMKYFNAMFSNRRNEYRLREKEVRLETQQRKAITKMWQEKYNLLDELVQINVRTPRYQPSADDNNTDDTPDTNTISLGEVKIDAKLFATKPTSIGGKAKLQAERIKVAPVIDVVGTEAICYPNSEAKKGRRVLLPYQTSRRMEAVRSHHIALDNLRSQKGSRHWIVKPNLFHVQKPKIDVMHRPVTTVARPRVHQHTSGPFVKKRPKTAML
ncbi:hypothetical protein KP79_PYT09795 [Mizuhopecten yessoensis]|uniref:Uncharacterized protein n=1 Tax=Mizuhopecten yessoensis TaxID=6573 RepID=A0A210PKV5_MIZYE|nr:hypothetical protein KP79_PYT09795 [Mizuhopecten yessoensis]